MDYEVLAQVIRMGYELLFESDSDDEKDEIEDSKIRGFAEETVPRFHAQQFRYHFRMSSTTFEHLLIKVHSVEEHAVLKGHPQLTLEKQLMITVWYLANLESFRQVALKFGITKSSCWAVLYRMCKRLLLVNNQYGIIRWPSITRSRDIARGFEEQSQFPGIVGAIDGSHIKILKPHDHPNSYINRKGYASVLLQGVCDHRKLFIDVFTGVPGSVHDSRLFQMSDLSDRISNDEVVFPDNGHLVGDLAYVLSEKLLVGFKDNGNLNHHQRNFNNKLSKARVVIENAFEWLKGRFRRLKLLDTVRTDLISLLIITACILHNVTILEGDLPDNHWNNHNDGREIQDHDQEIVDIRNEGGNANGRAKRQYIMYSLPQN